ncbi:hypothetical protein FA10DRAFT_264943, partial [Acaromyces ingoldii]
MPEDNEDRRRRLKYTVEKLLALIDGQVCSEELTETWTRAKGETVKEHGPRLADLKRALDDGKFLDLGAGRGVPMRLVTKTCKASWHYDGTWPLLASDESTACSKPEEDLPRSIHASRFILRPPGQHCVRLPPPDAEPGPPQRPDPSPEQIAQSYRDRGIAVPRV